MFEEFIEETKQLEYSKEDTILIKVKGRIPAEMVKAIENDFRDKLPENIRHSVGVIVIDSDADVEIIKRAILEDKQF